MSGDSGILPLTSNDPGVGRIPVDSQQTGFEAGEQFYFSYFFQDVPHTQQIIIKATLGQYSVNLFDRILNILKGGRIYSAYPAGYGETVTGIFTDVTSRIRPVNYNADTLLPSDSIWEINTNGVFTPGLAPSVGAPGSIVSSGSGNNSAAQYSGSNLKLGYPANAEFYIVMDHYGGNTATDLEFFMAWEERFND